MKAILTCGGTGGHITPALAIADALTERCPHADILFIGTERGMENEMVRAAGYPIRTLAVRGFARRLTLENLKTLRMTAAAVRAAKAILREFAPDIVIGTGGYASYPALRAAVALGIPAAVHESNAEPGLAVRVLARKLSRVWLGFAAAGEKLRGANVLVTGNPLPRARETGGVRFYGGAKLRVLSFGGSLGATALNDAALALMRAEANDHDISHIHATGRREYEERRREFERFAPADGRLRLLPFIGNMPALMRAADLVIARAGAMTVSELAAAGAAAILVPSPNVTGDHQRKNAAALAEKGAAVMLEEAELDRLPAVVRELASDAPRRERMREAIAAFARRDAAGTIAADVRTLTSKTE